MSTVFLDRLELLRYLRFAGARLVSVIAVMMSAQSLFPAATAVATAALIDPFTSGTPVASLVSVLGPLAAFATVLLLNHLCDVVLEPLVYLARSRIDGRHRERLAALVGATPTIEELEDPAVRDLIRLSTADPTNWTERTPGEGALTQLSLIARYLGIVGSAIVIATYSWWLIPVLVAPAMLSRVIRRRQWVAATKLWTAGIPEGRRSEYWKETATRAAEAKEMRIFGFADWTMERVEHHTLAMFRPAWARQLENVKRLWISFLLAAAPLVYVFVTVLLAVVDGRASVALGSAVMLAAWGVFQALLATADFNGIEGSIPTVQAVRELHRRLTPVPRTSPHPDPVDVTPGLAPRPPRVEFRNVSFTYPNSERVVLDQLDLEIRPGELLAIVGLNGAGKSTLAKLLCGLYRPSHGQITVDGRSLDDTDLAGWRQRIFVVFQEFVKYQLSLADNVRLGAARRPADEAAFTAAADEAGLGDLIERLPAGWDTPLSRVRTGGVDLSGGQWQQVVLARALYARHSGAQLLVLDEPTAHLDVRSEFALFQRIVEAAADCSIVLISHRLSTVRRADRIVVLDGGRIIESGTHDELISRNGPYTEMFTLQAARFRYDEDTISDGRPA